MIVSSASCPQDAYQPQNADQRTACNEPASKAMLSGVSATAIVASMFFTNLLGASLGFETHLCRAGA